MVLRRWYFGGVSVVMFWWSVLWGFVLVEFCFGGVLVAVFERWYLSGVLVVLCYGGVVIGGFVIGGGASVLVAVVMVFSGSMW